MRKISEQSVSDGERGVLMLPRGKSVSEPGGSQQGKGADLEASGGGQGLRGARAHAWRGRAMKPGRRRVPQHPQPSSARRGSPCSAP